MKPFTYDYPVSSYDLARPLKRFYALAIDVSIAHIIFCVLERVLGSLGALLPDLKSMSLSLFAIWWLAPYLYLVFADALPGGQSLGKRVMKIAVVGFPFEAKCTTFQSVLRNVPKLLLSLLDTIFIFFGHRRRLGDMLAGTIVVNAK